MTDSEVQAMITQGVRDELAALGGHLLSRYGNRLGSKLPVQEVDRWGSADLAALGGYLLRTYGPDEAA